LGSGTTLIAAETAGRTCFAVELNPLYVDVAVRRWQAFTGQKATLLISGRSFDHIAEERQGIAHAHADQSPAPDYDEIDAATSASSETG
jgi:hypothetical protein